MTPSCTTSASAHGWTITRRRGLALDFRPHSHHYVVMRQIRERNVGAIPLAGARMLGVGALGDGFFDLVADYDRDEALVALTLLLED